MNRSTKWYQANKKRLGLRDEYNARQRKWYHANLEKARALGRKHANRYRAKNRKKAEAATERCRLKRGARNRAYLEAYKREHPCIRCGEPDPIVLDFHHRRAKDKIFTISKWLWRASIKALEAEVAKCDVLCANCHRRLHYKSGER